MTIEVLSKEQIIERIRNTQMSMLGTSKNRDDLLTKAELLPDGYYVTESPDFEGALPEVKEGPELDEAYAKHKAITRHGMTPPEDHVEPEITEDDLPW